MEQRDDFVVRQQRRFIAQRWRQVARQISDRQLNFPVNTHAGRTLVHPSTAALVFSRGGIEIETTSCVADCITNPVKTYILMPSVNFIETNYIQSKEFFHDAE